MGKDMKSHRPPLLTELLALPLRLMPAPVADSPGVLRCCELRSHASDRVRVLYCLEAVLNADAGVTAVLARPCARVRGVNVNVTHHTLPFSGGGSKNPEESSGSHSALLSSGQAGLWQQLLSFAMTP